MFMTTLAQKLTSGKAKSSRKIIEIAKKLQVDAEWLTTGSGQKNKLDAEEKQKYRPDDIHRVNIIEWNDPSDLPDEKFALAPRVLVKLSAGCGIYTMDEENGEPLAFATKWLKEKGVKREDLVCVNSTGLPYKINLISVNSALPAVRIKTNQKIRPIYKYQSRFTAVFLCFYFEL